MRKIDAPFDRTCLNVQCIIHDIFTMSTDENERISHNTRTHIYKHIPVATGVKL